MKILLALILTAYYEPLINAQCSSRATRYCNSVCRPEYCPQKSVTSCPSDDYYLAGACTNCNGCPMCEKYRELGDCCYSSYGSQLRCKEGFTCSPKSNRCEQIQND